MYRFSDAIPLRREGAMYVGGLTEYPKAGTVRLAMKGHPEGDLGIS